MKMIIKGRHMDVTPAIREYAEEKIGRIAKVLDSMIMSAEVELFTERNPQSRRDRLRRLRSTRRAM